MKRVLIAAGLIAALAGGAVVTAQGPGFGHGFFGGRGPRGGPAAALGLRGIDLTDAQREQVRAIVESHRAALDEARRTLADARRAFADATRAEAVDEAAVRSQSEALAAAMANEAILQARIRTEVHGVLTAEQKQQLAERAERMKQRRAEMEKRRQERQQQRQQRRQQQ